MIVRLILKSLLTLSVLAFANTRRRFVDSTIAKVNKGFVDVRPQNPPRRLYILSILMKSKLSDISQQILVFSKLEP